MFGGRFGVSKKGSEDSLRSIMADFLNKLKVRQLIGKMTL
jgi:hypothetical protein